jgi:hypothetical protein
MRIKSLLENLKRRNHWEDLGIGKKEILKWIYEELGGKVRRGSSGKELGPVSGSCAEQWNVGRDNILTRQKTVRF